MIAIRDVVDVLVVIAPLKCVSLVDTVCLVGPVVDNCRGLRVGEEPRGEMDAALAPPRVSSLTE